MNITKLILAAAVAASATTAVPASAVEVVFANVTATAGQNFNWRRGNVNTDTAVFQTTATPTSNVAGATAVLFSLSGNTTPLFTQANFLLTGQTVNSAAVIGANNSFTQQVDTFTFSITSASAFSYGTINVAVNDVLLSGSVQNASITGTLGGSTGALNASTLGGSTIMFNPTPLLAFQPNSQFGLSFTLNSVTPIFAQANASSAISSFRSQTSGAFQSDPEPTFGSPLPPAPPAIPEPGTWAMMIVGLGLVGFARRRRSVTVAA